MVEAQAERERQHERERQIQQLQAERAYLEQELKSLGIFSFKRKKEIQIRLDDISNQLRET